MPGCITDTEVTSTWQQLKLEAGHQTAIYTFTSTLSCNTVQLYSIVYNSFTASSYSVA